MFEKRNICQRCVLPESRPYIWLDKNGICNVCQEHDKQSNNEDRKKLLESEFLKIINKYKGKNKYDCLVMCSGGKDSTSALYYIKKRYKLNPLSFTFDHGFETEDALENIRNAVDILGVDHLHFKSDFMKQMFCDIVKTGSKAVICHVCSIWYMGLTFDIAARFNIPIIIAGWTKGQMGHDTLKSRCGFIHNQPEFISMAQSTQSFLEEYRNTNSKYKDFPRSMEESIKKSNKFCKSIVLSPHWFLPDDSETYVPIIMKELKWKYPRWSYPQLSTNCYLNFISVYNSMKYYGYTHYHVEMSKMIRVSLMSRQEALKLLDINFDYNLLNNIASKLDHVYPQ